MLKAKTTKLLCPLCGSTACKNIFTAQSYGVNRCLDCKNAWTIPEPSLVDYKANDFHQQAVSRPSVQPNSLHALAPEWRQSIQMQTALISKHLRPASSVLEIGCGEGILLSELADIGFDVEGIEPSVSASERARLKGLNVTTSLFPEYFPRKTYDLVILSHVLEHIENPAIFMSQVAKMIPKRYLLIVQTNYRGLIPAIMPKRWYAWAPEEHFWHFTPQGLSKITESLNFREIELEYSSLVHKGLKNKLLQSAAYIFPSLSDQFHILVKSSGQ